MINSKKIAIALLALVGICFVAGPAMASETYYLYVYNKTDNRMKQYKGTKISVSVYHVKNSVKGSLKATKEIPIKGIATGIGTFKFGSGGCTGTKHRLFEIKTIDKAGIVGPLIASSRLRMKNTSCVTDPEIEFQGFVDESNDNFNITKEKRYKNKFYVYVNCNGAGNCERQ